MSEQKFYETPIIKKYKEAMENCVNKYQIDDTIPVNLRIYDGETCYAFNDVYDQVRMLGDLQRDSDPKYFNYILAHIWGYFKDVNNIYRYYWEIEKKVPEWFDKKYHPLMIPLTDSELEVRERLRNTSKSN